MNRAIPPSFWTPLLILSLVAVGCGSPTAGIKKSLPQKAPLELLENDLHHLETGDAAGFIEYDAENAGLFTRIFGGTTRTDVARFLRLRLRYFISLDEPNFSFSPREFGPQSGDLSDDDTRATTMAANAGFAAWFSGLLSGVTVRFNYRGTSIVLDDPRVGIALLGPGYAEAILDTAGAERRLPPEYREATLMHESRHSDCTGGITEKFLAEIRNAPSETARMELIYGTPCGHAHVPCPADHKLAGILACDREPYGAYTVENVYFAASMRGRELTSEEFNIVTLITIDTASRVLVPVKGAADMSSDTVIR